MRRLLAPQSLRLLLLTLLVCLGGCRFMNDDKGFFVNRDDDYLTMEERPALIVPSDLQDTSRQGDSSG